MSYPTVSLPLPITLPSTSNTTQWSDGETISAEGTGGLPGFNAICDDINNVTQGVNQLESFLTGAGVGTTRGYISSGNGNTSVTQNMTIVGVSGQQYLEATHAGIYLVLLSATIANAQITMYIYHNGSIISSAVGGSSSAAYSNLNCMALVVLAAGDTLTYSVLSGGVTNPNLIALQIG